jgi:hypothetical protein
VRRAVAERLGYDPFASDSAQTLRARLDHDRDGFYAVIELRDAKGQLVAERRLERAPECGEIAAAMALSMSIVIDPERALEKAASHEPTSGAAPAANETKPLPQRPTPPPSPKVVVIRQEVPKIVIREKISGTRGRLGASVHLALGTAPALSAGFTLSSGFRDGPLSLALEARYDAPASRALPNGGRVSAQFIGAAIAPCYHRAPFFGCGLLLAGFLRAESRGVTDARADAGLFSAGGARLGIEWPLWRLLSVVGEGDLLLSLRPLTAERNGQNAWENSLVTARLAAGMALAF